MGRGPAAAGPSLSLLKNKGKGDIKRGQRSKWGLKKCVTREYVCKTPPGFWDIGVTYIKPAMTVCAKKKVNKMK